MNAMNGLTQLHFSDLWHVMAPEMILVIGGFLILVLDLFMSKESSRRLSPQLGILFLIAAFVLTIRNFGIVADNAAAGGDMINLSNMLYVLDDFGNVFKLLFTAGTAVVLLMSIDFFKHNLEVKVAEYTYLMLFATVGAMVMASALDLITLFVGLELLSISSYVLVAMRRNHAKSTEGAMKYLVIGSVASAMALYGMSFLYGVTGQTNLAMGASTMLQLWDQFKPVLVLGFLLMLVGFGVKVALVPFHQWAPDTYEGAGNPVTSFLAVVSKAAGFALILRVFLWGFSRVFGDIYIYLVILAALTMVIGNVAALTQKNIKRLLAYSSVAQAGYLLIPLATLGKGSSIDNIWLSLGQTVFYLVAYLFMTMGAFAVLTVVTRQAGNETLEAFRGLWRRSPFLAVSMAVFTLSMAGMPLTAGFVGKFYIFLGTINTEMYWLGGLLFATSAIAFYYYFGVLKAIFLKDSSVETHEKIQVPASIGVTIAIGLIGTIVLGVYPDAMMKLLNGLHWFGQ
ncbi:NADH-quinone oxidoreductase subunit N [Tumebacillus flagellatus]|nr:NADH-quinone oxidoreductase subunit N [Tumebacillus flagellatus]